MEVTVKCSVCVELTSSNLYVIIVKALKTLSVEPVMVMILSGQEPSEMLTRALLCRDRQGVRGAGRRVT